jgi:ABC-type bacteriocin/lantibiotic exporter with double-glycine peptidase domain
MNKLLKSFYWIVPILAKYKNGFIILIPISTAVTIPTLMIAGSSSQFVDGYLLNVRDNFAIPIAWILLISTLVMITLLAIQSIVLVRVEAFVIKSASVSIFRRIFSLPYSYFAVNPSGETAGRIGLALQVGQQLITQVTGFTIVLTRALIILIFSLIISIQLTLLSTILLAVNVTLSFYITSRREAANKELAVNKGLADGEGLNAVANIESIKASALESEFFKSWATIFGKSVNQQQNQSFYNAVGSMVSTVSSFLLQTTVIILGGFLILEGKLSLGSLVAFQFLLSSIVIPINQIPQLVSSLQTLSGLSGRISLLFDVQTEHYVKSLEIDPSRESETESEKLNGDIKINNIDFNYEGAAKLFEGINVEIQAGKHLAIVGGSGSGKSTLIKIIAGLYHPTNGDIEYDGLKWDHHPDLKMRQSISYVPQEMFLFSDTLHNNISLWDPRFTPNDCYKAATMALMQKEIDSYPLGIQRKLNDNGSDLSGGQKQRIEIARALVRKPTIMLIDEGTSALDDYTEKAVMKNIKSIKTTLVTVAHRMHSAEISDYVIVLDKGKVVQEGPPESLRRQSGRYSELLKAEEG